jgi:hypothetical protein
MTDHEREKFVMWLQNEVTQRTRQVKSLGETQPLAVKAIQAEMAACRIVTRLLYKSSDVTISGTNLGADE